VTDLHELARRSYGDDVRAIADDLAAANDDADLGRFVDALMELVETASNLRAVNEYLSLSRAHARARVIEGTRVPPPPLRCSSVPGPGPGARARTRNRGASVPPLRSDICLTRLGKACVHR
jgi:hypothetical protein